MRQALRLVVLIHIVLLFASAVRAQVEPLALFAPRELFVPPPTGPAYPNALIQGKDGVFYGTSRRGGIPDKGTVFAFTPPSALAILYEFTGATDGSNPGSALIEARDGNLYGTTSGEEPSAHGTVYRVTKDSVFTTIHTFTGTDGQQPAALVEATDGFLYGVTLLGGAHAAGVLFKISTSGAFTVLHAFTGLPGDGGYPLAGLIQASDGNFYGTTAGGGRNNTGTVFKLSPSGEVGILHDFADAASGVRPIASVTQASDGNLYGSTFSGGAYNLGTLFRLSVSGAFRLLHSFTGGADGGNPIGALTKADNQSLYGTTAIGPMSSGSSGNGTLFSITFDGTVSGLITFEQSLLRYPLGPVIRAADGYVYGAAAGGWAFASAGGIFRLFKPPACTSKVDISQSGTTLTMTFTLSSQSPGLWFAGALDWSGDDLPTWWVQIPAVSPPATVTVPIENVPADHSIVVFSTVSPYDAASCGDSKFINWPPWGLPVASADRTE